MPFRIDGELVTCGTLPYLENKYCTSHFVEINTVGSANQDEVVKAFVAEGLDAIVYEALPYRFKIQIPFNESSPQHQLASIFDLLERKKAELNIKFYSVCKMNLEKVFIDLSRRQFEANEVVQESERPGEDCAQTSQRETTV